MLHDLNREVLMSQRIVRSVLGFLLVSTALSFGCAGEDDGAGATPAEQDEALGSAGKRCSVRGEPRVEQGCEVGEACVPYACTASIPPSCAGICKARPASTKGERCDVSGDPAVTTGCGDSQTCAVEACTESIPPHCWGTCEASRF
jgi:hypothetical protein